ncbi:MAG: histidinol-phosphatase [Alphaproteobacteria bacterium]|jgi:inositol-phosphate phosphatase/L-galactose 1-phosphate phosphatase/histidinol-phosphatase
MDDASRHLALAHRLADAARAIIGPYFRADLEIESKADDSPVTIADREAERAMRAIIEAECPDHGIRGEEFPEKTGAGQWHWYLDPIDGTKLFISGIPLFGTLIGLAHDGKPVLGIMDQAINSERWCGAMDGTANLNGDAIKTSDNEDLAKARLFTTSLSYYHADQAKAFARLSAATALTRMGTDCYAFAMLAMGFVDLVTETNLNEWDIAALVPIIENAGGVVTDWDGKPLRFDGQVAIPDVISAANPAIHAKALAVLRG